MALIPRSGWVNYRLLSLVGFSTNYSRLFSTHLKPIFWRAFLLLFFVYQSIHRRTEATRLRTLGSSLLATLAIIMPSAPYHPPLPLNTPWSQHIVTLNVLLPCIAAVFVFLRFYSRKLKGLKIGIDDWLVLFALFVHILHSVTGVLACVAGGVGHHKADLAPIVLTNNGKILVATQVPFAVGLGLTKCSACFLLRRVFDVHRKFQIFGKVHYNSLKRHSIDKTKSGCFLHSLSPGASWHSWLSSSTATRWPSTGTRRSLTATATLSQVPSWVLLFLISSLTCLFLSHLYPFYGICRWRCIWRRDWLWLLALDISQ